MLLISSHFIIEFNHCGLEKFILGLLYNSGLNNHKILGESIVGLIKYGLGD